ncbi:LysR family transcriptional regulator [Clostridium sp. 19966]|uniref:LysR family transcriptional regulator n=1 Tax=Clostridium sp. 19966 TaxID=2768166 RepID=UPI0028E67C9E|nr:LysR family transcriptional regulator [Clostridium sp. 19966]
MVNLEHYKIFYYVAKYNSITLAAKELFITQPAVSQAIKQLENSIGGTLFYRNAKGVKLTPEAEVLYRYVSMGYEYLSLGEKKFQELLALEEGEVRIGASDMTLKFYLLKYLEKFHNLYPKIKVKVTNAPTPSTLEYLFEGKIDFGIVTGPVEEDKNLNIYPVEMIQDIFIAGNRYESLKNKTINIRELKNYPIISLEKGTSTRNYMDNFFQDDNSDFNVEFELATSDLIVEFTARNLGIGFVVKNFAKELMEKEKLFEIKLENPIKERNICVVTNDKNPISPAGKKLLDLLVT